MDKETIIKKIQQAVKQNQILHLSNAFDLHLDWSDFIEALDYKYNHSHVLHFHREQLINKEKATPIVVYNKLDPVIFDLVRTMNNNIIIDDMKKISAFKDLALEIFEGYNQIAIKAIMNFVGNEADYHIHKDKEHVLSFHCIGKVEWRIYQDIDDSQLDQKYIQGAKYKTIILHPGDLLYIPKGLVHSVAIKEPRVSLITQAI